MVDNCINGRWVDGVCMCKQGYALGFDENNLNPKYCEKEIVAVIDFSDAFLSSEVLLHFTCITLTVLVFTWSIIAVHSVFVYLLSMRKLKMKTEKVELATKDWKEKKSEYEGVEIMNAGLWDPPQEQFQQLI